MTVVLYLLAVLLGSAALVLLMDWSREDEDR